MYTTKENRMDAHNVAIVVAPNIVQSNTEECRPEKILQQMEWTNILVEKLIVHSHEIFTY